MKKKKFEKTLIIQKNSMIDKNLVEKAEAFEKKLSEYGENTKQSMCIKLLMERLERL